MAPDETRLSAVQLASDDNSQHRAAGWRVHHAMTQINEMVCSNIKVTCAWMRSIHMHSIIYNIHTYMYI